MLTYAGAARETRGDFLFPCSEPRVASLALARLQLLRYAIVKLLVKLTTSKAKKLLVKRPVSIFYLLTLNQMHILVNILYISQYTSILVCQH
jgi:hypothetical protein